MRTWIVRVGFALAGAGMLVAEPRTAASAPEPRAFRCPEHDPVRQECKCTPPQLPDRNAGNEAVCIELAAPRRIRPAAAAPPPLSPPPQPQPQPQPQPPSSPGDRSLGVSLGVPLGLDESMAMELPRLEITAGKSWRRRGGAVLGVTAIGWYDARSLAAPAHRPGPGAGKVASATDLTLLGAAAALTLRWDGGRVPLLIGMGPAYQRASDADQLGLTAFVEVSIELRATVGVEWRLSARARAETYRRGSAGQLAMISLGPEARF